jgi:protein TonB
MAAIAARGRGLRARPALAAAAVEGVLAVAIFVGLSSGFHSPPLPTLEVTTLKAIATPEPPPAPQPDSGERAKDAAAPPAAKNEPSPLEAPKSKIVIIPPPVVAAPVAGTGSQAAAGAATAGEGTGAGGFGNGTGGGGTGGGGGARSAQRVAGALRDSAYPGWAKQSRAEGTVFVSFTVEANGRVSGCRVTRTSGYAELDALTCRLVEQRFRYRPALDRAGSPVATTLSTNFTWAPRG